MRGEHLELMSGSGLCEGSSPHAREHSMPSSSNTGVTGSSPHARGTRSSSWWSPRIPGIIPACAGNTGRSTLWRAHHGDHPRMRGEHEAAPLLSACDSGSSPHARGTLKEPPHELLDLRIIPACAGNTAESARARLIHGDHPRMRGEHFAISVSP